MNHEQKSTMNARFWSTNVFIEKLICKATTFRQKVVLL